jgi:hypothetical protein
MKYTIEYCDVLMDQELDKLGSDLVTLPLKLMQFRKATYDFIRETVKYIEITQEVSDDLKSLLRYTTLPMVANGTPGQWQVLDPNDYHRLITAEPFYAPNPNQNQNLQNKSSIPANTFLKKYKTIRIIKLGQEVAYNRDQFKKPTHEYPTVQRLSGKVLFDFGSDDGTLYKNARISYVKEPNFGFDESLMLNPNANYIIPMQNVIVDLPPISIHKIIDRATNSLRFILGSQSSAENYTFDQTFGKPNK